MKKLIVIIFFLFFIGVAFLLFSIDQQNKIDIKTVALSDVVAAQNLDKQIVPPASHVNMEDFYNTYGVRLLGDDQIKIISREEWGADNSFASTEHINNYCSKKHCLPIDYDITTKKEYTFRDKIATKEMGYNYSYYFKSQDLSTTKEKTKENGVVYEYLPMEEFVIHHTAGKITDSLEESIKEMKRIYLIHTVVNRWQDIGYHYFVDNQGRIFEGNLGGKYSSGGHSYFHNKGNLAIALMGDFRPKKSEMSPAMKNSLTKLILYLSLQYKIDLYLPQYHLRRKDLAGREWVPVIIRGHKDLDIKQTATLCPGVDLDVLRMDIYKELENLKIKTNY